MVLLHRTTSLSHSLIIDLGTVIMTRRLAVSLENFNQQLLAYLAFVADYFMQSREIARYG